MSNSFLQLFSIFPHVSLKSSTCLSTFVVPCDAAPPIWPPAAPATWTPPTRCWRSSGVWSRCPRWTGQRSRQWSHAPHLMATRGQGGKLSAPVEVIFRQGNQETLKKNMEVLDSTGFSQSWGLETKPSNLIEVWIVEFTGFECFNHAGQVKIKFAEEEQMDPHWCWGHHNIQIFSHLRSQRSLIFSKHGRGNHAIPSLSIFIFLLHMGRKKKSSGRLLFSGFFLQCPSHDHHLFFPVLWRRHPWP